MSHESDLGALLVEVGLIDAHGVCPHAEAQPPLFMPDE